MVVAPMPLSRFIMRTFSAGERIAVALILLGGITLSTACTSLQPAQPTPPLSEDIGSSFAVKGLPAEVQAEASAILQTIPREPRSVLEARRRAASATDNLTELLASEGYFSADVSVAPITSVTELPHFSVDPKQRFTVASVSLSGVEDIDPDTIGHLNSELRILKVGKYARTQKIEALEAALVQRLHQSGYAFANSETIDALASRETATLELTYILTPGPRIMLGDIALPADNSIAPRNIRVMQTWQRGDTYTPKTLDQLRKRLRKAGLFDGIGVQVAQSPDPDGLHPVELSYSKAKQRTISGGLSYSTTDGVGINTSWSRRNLTGRSDTLTAEVDVATIASHIRLIYARPNIGRYGRDLTLTGGLRHEETDAYDLNGAKISARISQPFNKQFTITAGATLDATSTRTVADAAIIEQVSLSFPVNATYSTVKAPLDPQRGSTAFLGVEPGLATGSSGGNFTRVLTSATSYKTLTPRIVGAIRGELGALFGDDDVPPDRYFFSGGGGSVRGFEYQSLSPRDNDGNILGGTSLFNISAELRWRKSERYGYVAFIDTGASANSLDTAFNDARSAFGVGIRYYPGFGPLRLDVATPIDRKDGEDPVQVYISIGQSF